MQEFKHLGQPPSSIFSLRLSTKKEKQTRVSAKLAVKLNSLPQWGKVAREA